MEALTILKVKSKDLICIFFILHLKQCFGGPNILSVHSEFVMLWVRAPGRVKSKTTNKLTLTVAFNIKYKLK